MEEYYKNVISGDARGFLAGSLRGVLWCASGVYWAAMQGVKRKRRLIRKRLPVPVVSVGNVTWGGTGKTPFVMMLLAICRAQGKRVGVLMRGYGDDEHRLFRKRFPDVAVLCGANRYRQAQLFLQNNTVDLFILDDGFQQWGIKRDLDIVLINCLDPWGNGKVLPAGCLREPLDSLRRADLVVLTHAGLVSDAEKQTIRGQVERYVSSDAIVEACHTAEAFFRGGAPEKTVPLAALKGKRAVIFSGIGSPGSFAALVRAQGITIVEELIFADHHDYSQYDFDCIRTVLEKNTDCIAMTTEKDFIRNMNLVSYGIDPYVLTIKLEIIKNNDACIDRFARLLAD